MKSSRHMAHVNSLSLSSSTSPRLLLRWIYMSWSPLFFVILPFLVAIYALNPPADLQTRSQQICRDLSDTISVRKMQLLGGLWPSQDLLASHIPWGVLWPPKRSWGGLWPPKSCIFLTEIVSDKSRKICCAAS